MYLSTNININVTLNSFKFAGKRNPHEIYTKQEGITGNVFTVISGFNISIMVPDRPQ
jgi:hypothetical protein